MYTAVFLFAIISIGAAYDLLAYLVLGPRYGKDKFPTITHVIQTNPWWWLAFGILIGHLITR